MTEGGDGKAPLARSVPVTPAPLRNSSGNALPYRILVSDSPIRVQPELLDWRVYWTLYDIMVFYDAEDAVREHEAMAAIDRALEALDQPSARQRVLRWAARKFQVETAAPMNGTIGAPFVEQQSAAVVSDGVDNAAAEQVRGNEPVDEFFRELAEDLQRLALERHRA